MRPLAPGTRAADPADARYACAVLLLPWHLTDHLDAGLNVTPPDDTVVVAGRPGTTGSPWRDLVGVYAGLRDAVAAAAGRGDLTLPAALGLTTLPEESVLLVDARDLDPPEVTALASSRVLRRSVAELDAAALPAGPLVMHVDLDVLDPAALAGLRFPAAGGPSLRDVADGIAAVARHREIAALSIAATWRPAEADRQQTDATLRAVLAAAGTSG
jgi:arginase